MSHIIVIHICFLLGAKAGTELYYSSNGGQTERSYGFTLLLKYRRLKAGVRTQGSGLAVVDSDIAVLVINIFLFFSSKRIPL